MSKKDSRIAYYGTWGSPGHSFRAIQGEFSAQEIDSLSRIDSWPFHEEMAQEGFCYVFWAQFLGYAIPFSEDDSRPGCVSAIFVEGAQTSSDILSAIFNTHNLFLHSRFRRRLPRTSDREKD